MGGSMHSAVSIKASCESCGGTVKPYHHHILVFTGTGSDKTWGPKVEKDIPLIGALADEVKRREVDLCGRGVKISAVCRDSGTGSGSGMDVALFPANLLYPGLDVSDVAAFVQHALVAPNAAVSATAAAPLRQARPYLDPSVSAAAAWRVALVCELPHSKTRVCGRG